MLDQKWSLDHSLLRTPDDTCPDCMEIMRPWRIWWESDGIYADYLCTGCGNSWWTGWSAGSLA